MVGSMESRDALAMALKWIVPVSVSVAFAIVVATSWRVNRERVAWWPRAVAWLALAKATRFVLEAALGVWAAVHRALPSAAITYQAAVCALYLSTVPLLASTAMRLLRGDARARTSGIASAILLVTVEAALLVARRAFGADEAAHHAVGIAAASTRGSVMMTAEALVIGIASRRAASRARA
jgi:hypothetical protein